jgi:hypothetical protein
LKITNVGVRKLVTMEGYNNHAVEAQAIVEDGESPEIVLETLTVWVDDRIKYERDQRRLQGRGDYLTRRVADLESEHERLERLISEANAVIEKHGELRELAVKAKLDIPGLNVLGDNLPF